MSTSRQSPLRGDALIRGRSIPQRSAPIAAFSSSTLSMSTSLRTPARSFHARSFNGPLAHIDNIDQHLIRQETQDLATRALSDATSIRSLPLTPSGVQSPSIEQESMNFNDQGNAQARPSGESPRQSVIQEVSESTSSEEWHPPSNRKHSALSEMIRASSEESSDNSEGEQDSSSSISNEARSFEWRPAQDEQQDDGHVLEAAQSTHSPGDERTSLLLNGATSPRPRGRSRYGTCRDVEDQVDHKPSHGGREYGNFVSRLIRLGNGGHFSHIGHPKSWNIKKAGRKSVVASVQYIPAVVLGLLMNVLDALSYGMILFPLGVPLFADLGADGISMFYVSCIVSQLIYSLGGSIFKGAVGSEMIEVVPFFHKMALMIMAQVGEEHPKAVLATTVVSYAASSIFTGIVFFLMGYFKVGSLIGFFPRHILIGCIGGIGYFLLVTGLEVSARLNGNLEYNVSTLKALFQPDTVPLWLIPLVLALALRISSKWITSPWYTPAYFFVIPIVFYLFVLMIPQVSLSGLRESGWVFEAPQTLNPWYHFYTLYDFPSVDWTAFAKTVPNMLALTFFGILHVPINVPALGVAMKEDYFDLDRELIAHGFSNALSGCVGSIQNYLVYTNSLLFIRVGGTSRIAGIMLAIGSVGILVVGPGLIGFIPIMLVGALIFLLAFDLLVEAIWDTRKKADWLEYITIWIIVLVMGIWDFVLGILVGIILACVSYVVKTSRKSAIRAMYSGQSASSTVRRHPIHHRFLREAGRQTYVIKLAGYLFFGTIVSVESRVREILAEDKFSEKPIRYLVLDLQYVDGLDYSAAEAFERIERLARNKGVHTIISGYRSNTDIGERIRDSGLFGEGANEESDVKAFEDLNSALEYCENELLKAFYARQQIYVQLQPKQRQIPCRTTIDATKAPPFSASFDTIFGSPRNQHLHQVAMMTLQNDDAVPASRWRNFRQPLPLLLQTFHGLTDKTEDFWQRLCPFLEKKTYAAGTVVYAHGDRARGFYILEEGILRANYRSARMNFYESIVAGTTCGELPFFSETLRTATVVAEKKCMAWRLNADMWDKLQKEQPDVATELLKIGLKLTSERMSTIVSYMMTIAG